jgi:cell wall-associated NlpC family hydrolase
VLVVADPRVIQNIRKAAQATGADPAALLAMSLTETGARTGPDVKGDNGTSFDWAQFHRGGALGNHSPAWAGSFDSYLNRAREFKRLGVHGGKGAAAVQRPADPAGYAVKVDRNLAQARSLLGNPAPALPVARSVLPQPTAPDTVDNTLIQSILSQNAELAGIPEIQMPTVQPIAPRAKPAPVKVSRAAKGTGLIDGKGTAIVEVARKYLGVPYVWGGTTRKGLDCSGLLQLAASQVGVKIPRTTYQQIKVGQRIAPNQLQPGDAVFFGNASAPHHVGIYVGAGKFIQAPRTGDVVKISTLGDRKDFVAARRYT